MKQYQIEPVPAGSLLDDHLRRSNAGGVESTDLGFQSGLDEGPGCDRPPVADRALDELLHEEALPHATQHLLGRMFGEITEYPVHVDRVDGLLVGGPAPDLDGIIR